MFKWVESIFLPQYLQAIEDTSREKLIDGEVVNGYLIIDQENTENCKLLLDSIINSCNSILDDLAEDVNRSFELLLSILLLKRKLEFLMCLFASNFSPEIIMVVGMAGTVWVFTFPD
nr:hypothetical protein Iba_chr11aCG14630 [Ipomoea batatas]